MGGAQHDLVPYNMHMLWATTSKLLQGPSAAGRWALTAMCWQCGGKVCAFRIDTSQEAELQPDLPVT